MKNGFSRRERKSIERDRDLAWELYEVQPQNPKIAELTASVLARVPSFTGMTILLALHREACGEVEEARRLLRGLIGQRDRQYVNAVKKLRDLELHQENYPEALRLAEIVLREQPDADWMEQMEYGSALIFTGEQERGWGVLDQAVEQASGLGPEEHGNALGQRAARLLTSGARPERVLPAAEAALAADPSNALLAITLGYAYLYHYRAEEAEQLFRGALREDPTNEPAEGGLRSARAMLDPIERGLATMDDIRAAEMGEYTWRMLYDALFGTGFVEAVAALDAVLPAELAASLRPPLDVAVAQESGGETKLLVWHDGQQPGSGALWGAAEPFRLMSGAEVAAMDEQIEQHPDDWPQWKPDGEYYTQLGTDEAGAYLIEGPGGRLYRRAAGEPDRVVAASLADWLWDRVVAFGGPDPRPGSGATGPQATE